MSYSISFLYLFFSDLITLTYVFFFFVKPRLYKYCLPLTHSKKFQLKYTKCSSGHVNCSLKWQCIHYFLLLTVRKHATTPAITSSFSGYYSLCTTTSSYFCSIDPVNMPTGILRYFCRALTLPYILFHNHQEKINTPQAREAYTLETALDWTTEVTLSFEFN